MLARTRLAFLCVEIRLEIFLQLYFLVWSTKEGTNSSCGNNPNKGDRFLQPSLQNPALRQRDFAI